jgi:superkiller protein 3
VLNIVPEFIPAQMGLARLLMRDGWQKKTIEMCKNILDTGPENVEALQIMGTAYIGIQDFKAAEKQFKKILELKPSIGDTNLAYLSLASGQLSKCIRQCEAIIKINPEDANAYEILGLARVRRGEFDKGIEQFVKAIEIDQNSINAFLNLAKVHVVIGNNEEAIKTLGKLISLDAQNLQARIMLATLYVREANADEAAKTLERVFEINPNYVPGYALASIYMLQGRTDKAIGLFNRALKLGLDSAITYVDFAVAYQQKGKYKASILYGQKAVELKPEIPSFRVVMANLYTANGDFVKAMEQVELISMLNDVEKKVFIINRLMS